MRNHNLPKQLSGDRKPRGLYDPRFEHDACGVGIVCHMKGEKSHRIIADGLQILVNLTHRGACGCDETTGDGAGILMQMPHAFLQKISAEASISLPGEKEYASGLVFLPSDPKQRKICMDRFETVVCEEKQQFLGWRKVPVASETLGDLARQLEPVIYQIFIGRGVGIDDPAHFERKLFAIRKVIEGFVRESGLTEASSFHIPSLSSRTLVYKAFVLPLYSCVTARCRN